MIRKTLFTLIVCVGFLAAGKIYNDTLAVGEIVSVYDGDTFRCNIPNVRPVIGENISIRLSRIQAPEIRTRRPCVKRAAIAARDRLREILHSSENIQLRALQRDKYFRINAEVYVDGVNVNDLLMEENLAVPYDGKSRKPEWACRD